MRKMKYKISEFVKENEEGNRFFVEAGQPYNVFLCFYDIRYEVVSAHKTFNDAVAEIEKLKTEEPIYHIIK